MIKRALLTALFLTVNIANAANTLRVISAGPVGEVATAAEANEVRVVFSEPMVALGRIPDVVTAPFFQIRPAVNGAFRWSGTTTLIFTPKPPPPFATAYVVTIDQTATSVAGNKLDRPYEFSFSTPAVHLLSTNSYRKANGAVVIGLRFNQPVNAQEILPKIRINTVARPFDPPSIRPEGVEMLKVKEPQSLEAFEKKVKEASQAAASNGVTMFVFQTTEWDHQKLGVQSPDFLVLETKPGVAPETHLEVRVGDEPPYIIDLEPTLFVIGPVCAKRCDPDRYNGLRFRARDSLSIESVRKAVSITDITEPAKQTVLTQKNLDRDYDYPSSEFSFDDLGYTLMPARRYLVRVDSSLSSNDGQTLGYTWIGSVANSYRSAFISFGDGQGVWESTGGAILPFHARNYRSVQQWLTPLTVEETMPVLQMLRGTGFTMAPDRVPQPRKLNPTADKIQSFGLDISKAVGPENKGLLWAAIKPGETIANAAPSNPAIRATLVQVTNLGISVKDSPQNVVVLVTALDTAKPVGGAAVSIRDRDNKVVWSGVTDEHGLVTADARDLRLIKTGKKDEDPYEQSWRAITDLHFIVVAEKDGDIAYSGSDWNEGIQPWEFGTNFDISEARRLLRGSVFTDRGVYKLGEEIHFKTIVRHDTPNGMQLLPPGSKVQISLADSHGKVIDKRTVAVNEWSSAEWTYKLPVDAPLGTYNVIASTTPRDSIGNTFLVAAYRRPDFRVDVTLGAPTSIAGTQLDGTIVGRYLHGGVMAGRDVKWTLSKIGVQDVPDVIRDRFPEERYSFLGWDWDQSEPRRVALETKDDLLNSRGELPLKLDTDMKAGWPFEYRLEGDVTDVTRQHIAGRATYRVDPAPWYIGLKAPSYFADATKGIDTEVLAVALDGTPTAGVDVHLTLTRIQWNSVRRATGNGFYEWDSERKDIPVGTWDVTTKAGATPLHIALPSGGEYRLVATASDPNGRSTTTRLWFYALGEGYTSWQRYDHNRIDLVPEKKTYKPGDVARIMVKSPWEKATALLTTEREGVRTTTPFNLTSTQQTITVPITEADIPNVYVSVLLVKGRTRETATQDDSDPGKPAFRLGYTELTVVDAAKRLQVGVKANAEEYRPASKANIDVNVRDAKGQPSQSEVTLWAVDYGVLSLTAYQTPDVLESIYLRKALQVLTEDSRQRIVSRRVLTPKGAAEGGGGGREAAPGTVRKDFRVLAFWLGSIVTDANGHATTSVTLPESLTTYRIMAVAGDRQSRFGWAQNEIKVNKPVMLMPAFPRFMALGDKAYFGGTVNSQKISGKATVTIRSLDPVVIAFSGEPKINIDVKPDSAVEARFEATAKSIGTARVQMTVTLGREGDAFEDVIPVRLLVSPETVAAYGEANPRAQETLELPTNVVPNFGGLHLELASTQMVGLGEGASYLVTYPYGCAEQRSSAALALVLTSDLGEAFHLPGIDPKNDKPIAQATLRELENFQCGDGGFAFWPGQCTMTSPYLTSYVLHVYQRAQKLGYTVNKDMLKRAYEYLERNLNQKQPDNEGWWPAYTAWQAFSVKTLAEGGRNVDSHVNRLYGYIDRMPVFAIAYLSDAMVAKGEKGKRVDELHRRMTNAILPEGGQAHVGELADPYLLWFWNSNVRSTAIVLGTLVRQGDDEEIVKRMVRWLMSVRKDGRWGNTQENAWAMEALVDYYRKYEAETPDFAAVVTAGAQTIARDDFRGRSTDAKAHDLPIGSLTGGPTLPIVFDKQGTGTLFYLMRLRYASADAKLQPLDAGFSIDRTYRVHDSTDGSTSFNAGDLITVTLRIRNTKERRFVALTDPIPAGTEPVETSFATTSDALVEEQMRNEEYGWQWWRRGGFDYFERHDDRVNVFATRLGEGEQEYTYLLRATTAGTFITAPAHVEEMYEPEVFGRTGTTVIEVKR